MVNLRWVALCNKTCHFPLFTNSNFFPRTLLNGSSFTSNSYFVSLNSDRIMRNCRVVTIEMKLVLTNYLSTAEETDAASEEVLDAFTQTVWWSWGAINAFTLQHFKCINHFIRLIFYIFFLNIQINKWKNVDSFGNQAPLCVAQRHTTVLLRLWSELFSSAKLRKKQSIFCLKSKSLDLSHFLFIEILLFKISATLQSCWYCYSGKHHGRLMLLT